MPYITIKNGEVMNGGIIDMNGLIPDDVPPHWVAYFNHPNIDEAFSTVKAEGGEAVTDIMDTPVGKFFVAADTEGANFVLMQVLQADP